jgi:hypothetical protein
MSGEGVITLSAESSLEEFALRQWIQQAEQTTYIDEPDAPRRIPVIAWRASSLIVDPDTPTGGQS